MEVIEATDGHARFGSIAACDLAALVATLPDAGQITSFVYQPPTLSELFRQAVAA